MTTVELLGVVLGGGTVSAVVGSVTSPSPMAGSLAEDAET